MHDADKVIDDEITRIATKYGYHPEELDFFLTESECPLPREEWEDAVREFDRDLKALVRANLGLA